DLPILVYETKRKPGLNADGTPAADMLYGDMTKEEIEAIPTYMHTHMFAVDDWMLNFASPDIFFKKFREMATTLFSSGELKFVILAMIAKFQKKEGGEFRHPALTRAVRAHPETQAFVTRLQSGINTIIRSQRGEINTLPLEVWMQEYNRKNDKKLWPPAFHNTSDIIGGLTMSINDVWAAKAELVQYDRVGRYYTGKVRVTFYDHFGLDIPDIGPDPTNGSIKKYGMLAGFRGWFILQHMKQFGYKPFITVMEMDYPIKGTL
ncbi:DUF3289 family protein, partial [Lonsdalea populi]|uniref:DUF3289 family protein n=1 Tax=Lonsdalea populi TaxID=1172565 RepID=UPI000DCA5010